MDYKKIAIYTAIVLIGLGFWIKDRIDNQSRLDQYDRFAGLYAETAIMSQLYRGQEDRFKFVRDSLMHHYGFSKTGVALFQRQLEGDEERWSTIWEIIGRKTDSLAKYYRTTLPPAPKIDSSRVQPKLPEHPGSRVQDSIRPGPFKNKKK